MKETEEKRVTFDKAKNKQKQKNGEEEDEVEAITATSSSSSHLLVKNFPAKELPLIKIVTK